MKCRNCNAPLNKVFIDLGLAPPSNSYLSEQNLNKQEPIYPLKLFVCETCFLVQIDEHVKATDIFNADYAYFSSYSSSWLNHCKAYAEMITWKYNLNFSSLVIEIASNDGYLLQYFKEKNIPVLGIEPSLGTAKVALQKGIDTLVDFFGKPLAEKIAGENKKADLVLGNNVLAHVPDIHDFVGGLKSVLKDEGVITMEFPHILQMIKNNQFDTIYHEHFSYFSVISVAGIFERNGLKIFDVEELPTHGGSLRIYAKHKEDDSKAISTNIDLILGNEQKAGLHSIDGYTGFQESADIIRSDLLNFLNTQKNNGKKIAAYGAAAKGNTLLNYCGITGDLIDFVVDKSPHKQGKFMPGSHIPVVSENEILKKQPDFVVILPWNIKDEIIEQLSYIRQWDGQFIISIPTLKVL